MNNTKKPSKTRRIVIKVLVIIIIACFASAAVLFFFQKGEEQPPEKSKGVVGTISDNWDINVSDPEESEEKRPGTQIPGYSSAVMKSGDTTLKLRIGNPKDNHVGMFAKLKLADGTVLYESPLLKPGQGLEEVPLNKTLDKGEYEAIVEYNCVLLEDGTTPLNSAESGFRLYVD